jgi:alpha-L-fucosidase 2
MEAWREFWAGSAVYIPERRMEFLWYFGLYLLASSARRGSVPPGLQGLWPMDGRMPPWRGDYHADMNVQETFWPACATGHLDLLDSWCDLMKDCLEPAREFTRQFFGTEGTYWPCSFLPRYTFVPCWGPVQFAWSNAGWLGWLVWLRWRHSMDTAWLAHTGYPIVSEIFKFYRANLKAEDDGRLHIPLSSSPEYRENKPAAWCKDPNIDIALIRRCCEWVMEMEQAMGKDELSGAARDVRAKLVPYHLTAKKELCLWAGKPLDESHRHPSHLMAIHPAMDLTIEDDANTRAIIEASLQQFFALGQYRWAGHTYGQMCSFAAVVGRAEFAYDCLLHLAEYWLGPNGLHFNRDTRRTGTTCFQGQDLQFTMETNCAACAGISDMLVQGWRDIVRVFPAVPEHWRDVAFRDLLTEGAFRVSAVRQGGQTVWVKIVAGVARTLRLRNPFGDNQIEVTGAELRRQDDLLVAEMQKDQVIILHPRDAPLNFEESAMQARQHDVSRLGLR